MAINTKFRVLPGDTINCIGTHTSGELCFEAGAVSISVQDTTPGLFTTFERRGVHSVPSPAGVTAGTALYAPGATPANGATLQPYQRNHRSVAIPSVLVTAAAGNTYVGRAYSASRQEGATTMVDLELPAPA